MEFARYRNMKSTVDKSVDIVELDREDYGEIKGLWEGLNAHHGELSQNFRDHFASLTFEKRMQAIFRKDHCAIFAAIDGGSEYEGYCIASAQKDRGEVESLYVNPVFRNRGIGAKLVRVALDWLDGQGCAEIFLFVAEGNDSVLEYYHRFGFYKRFDLLQRKRAY